MAPAETVLNGPFMSQSVYSEAYVRAMADAFRSWLGQPQSAMRTMVFAAALVVVPTLADNDGGRVSHYGLIAAAGILAALPPLAIGWVLQGASVLGPSRSGVKG